MLFLFFTLSWFAFGSFSFANLVELVHRFLASPPNICPVPVGLVISALFPLRSDYNHVKKAGQGATGRAHSRGESSLFSDLDRRDVSSHITVQVEH